MYLGGVQKVTYKCTGLFDKHHTLGGTTKHACQRRKCKRVPAFSANDKLWHPGNRQLVGLLQSCHSQPRLLGVYQVVTRATTEVDILSLFFRVNVCVCVFFTLNRSSTRRHPAHPVSVLILHPRKISSVVTMSGPLNEKLSECRFAFSQH